VAQDAEERSAVGWLMRPLFTIHAGEFLVGQHIESQFKGKHVWVPTRDTGIDLLVTNAANKKAVTLQVKFSRDFLPVMNLKPFQQSLRSCTWFSLDREKIVRSTADYWVLVLLGFESHTKDYLIIRPKELRKRLENLHGVAKRYQCYVWVTKQGRAWLTRGIASRDQEQIAKNTFKNSARDITRHLNDWSAIRDL
jgi:hypothetical protein